MSDEIEPQKNEPKAQLLYQPPPGYFTIRRMLKRAQRLQDVIRHKERWGNDVDFAEPLEKLFPKYKNEKDKAYMRLDEEIGKLQPVVFYDLTQVMHLNTGVTWKSRYAKEGEKPKQYDLILDYFRLPQAENPHDSYDSVMKILTNGIGMYEARKKRAFWEMFNPIHWIAYIIRLPILVMMRAGFGSQEMIVGIYGKTIRILLLAILVFLALKYGIEVQWKEIWTWVLRLI